MRLIAALVVGEVLLLGGLALAWLPAALIAGGVQLVAVALLADDGGEVTQ